MSNVTRTYTHIRPLKYGCNPHQKPSNLYACQDEEGKSAMPFTILNGNPGYINLLDALNSWQLVLELKKALNLPAAASFKHVSPAGAAVAVPLTPELEAVYGVGDKKLTPLATAYLRARNADPKSSFGDFAALSDVVDEETAMFIKVQVSDGIIAPGYDEKALEILKQKKKGGFVILQGDPTYTPPEKEYREVFGVVFEQLRNSTQLTEEHLTKVVTANKNLTEDAKRDMLIASITTKYTQSNSVGFAHGGQMIGVGAGQQSRVDCVLLAGQKLCTWYLRQHPKVQELKFLPKSKKVTKTNAAIAYIQGNMTGPERKAWEALFTVVPEPLTEEEKADFMSKLTGVSISSDAFFPFRDNIDTAAKFGVKYIAQPGGSNRDDEVTAACDEYDMVMSHTGVRLFHH